ncbi:MAG: cobalamin-dependent protein [Myxococcota bacterium]
MRSRPKARVALVAVDTRWMDPVGTFLSFSYGIETLRASLRAQAEFDDDEVLLLDLSTPDPEQFLARLREFRPTLVGLSLYIWSLEVFAEVVTQLRRFDPGIVIVAGGPAARRSVLDLPPHRRLRDQLDAVVPGEGEAIIRALVREHHAPGWATRIPGLDLPGRGLWRSTGPAERPDIERFPSPYQLGLAPPGKTGYVETFRGCPIHCSFCQWGEQKSDRVHSEDYLRRHLEGLAKADVTNAFFLDAAFNLSPRAFRNLVAAERDVGALRRLAVHGHLYPTYLRDEHLEFFAGCGQLQASIGIQSFDPEVLHGLGRPFDLDRFERVLTLMQGRLPVDVELIFGLPGDNPRSFRKTLERSLALADTVKIFRCLVLPDALLDRSDPSHAIDFDPQTFALRSCAGWTPADLEREWARVQALAQTMHRPVVNDDWVGFTTHAQRVVEADERPLSIESARERGAVQFPIDRIAQLRQTIGRRVSGWRLRNVRSQVDGLHFDLDGPEGNVVLEVISRVEGQPSFTERDGLAYSHRGPVGRAQAPLLRKLIDIVHPDALPIVRASGPGGT